MTLTLEEVTEQQERLRQEIMERECLLAAFDVMHGYLSKGHRPRALAFGSLVSALSPALRVVALPGPITDAIAPEPAALPAPASQPPYVHPELEALGFQHGSNVRAVRWAIARMTDDYSLADIMALLLREGYWITGAQISVVLNRMRDSGEVEQIERSRGPIPARFRKPASAIAEETNGADLIENPETSSASVALS